MVAKPSGLNPHRKQRDRLPLDEEPAPLRNPTKEYRMNSVTKLPTHADRVNAAEKRASKALNQLRDRSYEVGFKTGRFGKPADEKEEREAASEATDALTALVELALSNEAGVR
jgi:hypothetical protein